MTDMIKQAQETVSCGSLPKSVQSRGKEEHTFGRIQPVVQFDLIAKETGIFVGRKEILEQMRGYVQPIHKPSRKRMIYLLGMGGVGKTQLGLEFAKQDDSSFENVFWIDMASNETAIRGFRSIYQRLQAGNQSACNIARALRQNLKE